MQAVLEIRSVLQCALWKRGDNCNQLGAEIKHELAKLLSLHCGEGKYTVCYVNGRKIDATEEKTKDQNSDHTLI